MQCLTLLLNAVFSGRHEHTARVLLDAGNGTEARFYRSITPLHHAAEIGSEAIATLFIDGGADNEVRDEKGSTPLNSATKRRQEDRSRHAVC
jgi:ankyrin repeat protein